MKTLALILTFVGLAILCCGKLNGVGFILAAFVPTLLYTRHSRR